MTKTTALALFDLDGTITWHDTFVPFLVGHLRRRPRQVLGVARLPAALLRYLLSGGDRGVLKAQLLRVTFGDQRRAELDAWAAEFVAAMRPAGMFRPAALAAIEAHRRVGDRLILMSASPDLYVPRVGALLGFERTVSTEVQWRGDRLDGTLRSPNRRGPEKLRCLERLRQDYPGERIVAYGNSASDLAHMRCADRAVLVNASPGARRAAAAAGIPCDDWQ